MSFRIRVFVAFLAAVLIPLGAAAVGVRGEIGRRLRAQYEERVASLVSVIEGDVERRSREIGERLDALGEAVAGDNRLRAAVAGSRSDRGYLLDYAGEALRLTGLSVLRIQDSRGRILSSGHFRNEFDVLDPGPLRALTSVAGGTAIVRTRTAGGSFLALTRVDSVRLGDRALYLVGGIRVGEELVEGLTRDPELSVTVVHPGGAVPTGDPPEAPGAVAEAIALPYVESDPGGEVRTGEARIEISTSRATLRELRRRTDLWFGIIVGATVVVALLLAAWLSSRVTRPLEDLASKTAVVDLDRLDVDFGSHRRDEIGQLSRLLESMTDRLRASARELREAERRATLGELARQVNHDIRNGLAPLRNVLRHLEEVAREAPSKLAAVFEERRGTLDSSVSYLETLAGSYRRLSTRPGSGVVEVNPEVRRVVEGARGRDGVVVRADCRSGIPAVGGDPVTLRRIVENLVSNATEAVAGAGGGRDAPGTVTVRTGEARGKSVRIVVEDTGVGMTEEERSRAFDDFYTTREEGTGLGLSVVRRLVMDLGGSIELESEEGRGTRVAVELPAARPPGSGAEDGEER